MAAKQNIFTFTTCGVKEKIVENPYSICWLFAIKLWWWRCMVMLEISVSGLVVLCVADQVAEWKRKSELKHRSRSIVLPFWWTHNCIYFPFSVILHEASILLCIISTYIHISHTCTCVCMRTRHAIFVVTTIDESKCYSEYPLLVKWVCSSAVLCMKYSCCECILKHVGDGNRAVSWTAADDLEVLTFVCRLDV